MSYQLLIPTYSYLLPCGHVLRTTTKATETFSPADNEEPETVRPEDMDDLVWLACVKCDPFTVYGMTRKEAMAIEKVPREATPKCRNRISAKILSQRRDRALLRDRVLAYFREHWDGDESAEVICARVRREDPNALKDPREVYRVARDYGYELPGQHDQVA